MSDISAELQNELSARAKQYYPDVLTYHNWGHALDMMRTISDLAERSINSHIAGKRNLLVVIAAWHDADYANEYLGGYATKEERSAELALESLPELSDEDRDILYRAILDTIVTKNPKSSLFGDVTHAADVGYFAASNEHFMERLMLMREEWGSPDWQTVVDRTVVFGGTVLEEAKQCMPAVLSPVDCEAWTSQIANNLEFLQKELDAGRLG